MCPSPVPYTSSFHVVVTSLPLKSRSLSWVWFSGLLSPKVGAWIQTIYFSIHLTNYNEVIILCQEPLSVLSTKAAKISEPAPALVDFTVHPGNEQSARLLVIEVRPGVGVHYHTGLTQPGLQRSFLEEAK